MGVYDEQPLPCNDHSDQNLVIILKLRAYQYTGKKKQKAKEPVLFG